MTSDLGWVESRLNTWILNERWQVGWGWAWESFKSEKFVFDSIREGQAAASMHRDQRQDQCDRLGNWSLQPYFVWVTVVQDCLSSSPKKRLLQSVIKTWDKVSLDKRCKTDVKQDVRTKSEAQPKIRLVRGLNDRTDAYRGGWKCLLRGERGTLELCLASGDRGCKRDCNRL